MRKAEISTADHNLFWRGVGEFVFGMAIVSSCSTLLHSTKLKRMNERAHMSSFIIHTMTKQLLLLLN